MARIGGNPDWVKGGVSPNPHGRPPGPTAPTLLLKEAFLRAANTAGGGGPTGLHDYLVKVALSHPQVFVAALSKIIPFEVSLKGSGNVTVNIIERFEDGRADPKLINGRANGHNGADGNGADDRAPE